MAAYLSSSLSLSSSMQVKFSVITSAQGDYHDDALGAFTCPVDGDYLVSSILRKSSSGIYSYDYYSGTYYYYSESSSSWSMSIKQGAGKQPMLLRIVMNMAEHCLPVLSSIAQL